LPDAAIGVPRLCAAVQAAHGALRGACGVRLSAWGRSRGLAVNLMSVDTGQCAPVALSWPALAMTDHTIDQQPTSSRDPVPVSGIRFDERLVPAHARCRSSSALARRVCTPWSLGRLRR
jgi:hypothetical protein